MLTMLGKVLKIESDIAKHTNKYVIVNAQSMIVLYANIDEESKELLLNDIDRRLDISLIFSHVYEEEKYLTIIFQKKGE